MPQQLPLPRFEQHGDRPNLYWLTEPYEYEDDVVSIVVPAGLPIDLEVAQRGTGVDVWTLSPGALVVYSYLRQTDGNPPEGAISPPGTTLSRREIRKLLRRMLAQDGVDLTTRFHASLQSSIPHGVWGRQPELVGGTGDETLPPVRYMPISSRKLARYKLFELTEDFSYTTDAGDIIRVPAGFCYDQASVPQPFWGWITPNDVSPQAALVHDYLYRYGGELPGRKYNQREADDIFMEIMAKANVGRMKRKVAYWAVRLVGRFAWNKTDADSSPAERPLE